MEVGDRRGEGGKVGGNKELKDLQDKRMGRV